MTQFLDSDGLASERTFTTKLLAWREGNPKGSEFGKISLEIRDLEDPPMQIILGETKCSETE